jgi:glycosyltransferase involved in cell wall biosynthesis
LLFLRSRPVFYFSCAPVFFSPKNTAAGKFAHVQAYCSFFRDNFRAFLYLRTSMKIKYIYWFTYYNLDAPSIRYRAKYPLEELRQKQGINYCIVYPGYDFKSLLIFFKAYFGALFFRKKNSAIVFQKIYTKRIYSKALKFLLLFRKKNTFYDIDDAEYEKFPPETIHHFIKNCAFVSVGSNALADYAKKINPRVFLLTSPVMAHQQLKEKRNAEITIGWIGCFDAHRKSMYGLLFPALKNSGFKINLVLLGLNIEEDILNVRALFSSNKNITLEIPENINWRDEISVYKMVKEFDIGIAPLLDTSINRAKSAFKLKQYFSCGVPALASSVGENALFLRSGVNGFFCDSPEEIKEGIEKIRNMQENDYNYLCNNALASAKEFSLENYCSIFLNALQEA